MAQGAPPAGAAPVVKECANPRREWIWCDDFEQDRLRQYFEYEDVSGRFARVAGVGVKGSFGMRARFARGETSAGSLHLAVGKVPDKYFRPVDAGTTTYRELYWRLYVRYQPGWTGGVGYKLTRAMSFTSSSWSEAMVAHLWGGDPPDTNYLQLDPVSGTDPLGHVLSTKYNDFARFHWLGRKRGTMPLGDAAHVGQWYCVEVHARLNVLCQTVRYPPDSGVAIRTFHVLRLLARRFDVTALCFYRRKGGAVSQHDLAQRLEALRSLAAVEAFPVPQEHSAWRLAWD